MKKSNLFFIIFNIATIIFIISFFTFLFIKNFNQIKNIFNQPISANNNEEEINSLLKDLDKNLEIYFNFKNSANK
ncbi:MAG: hypothetical protein KatS3mg094_477 [Candidatus Parcubacteria bacterium]|nr:MAG: hypothetical protein KatS3mg094_477 [Candidatus Parcubacteria bacterium]